MVMLRHSGGANTAPSKPSDLDSSSEFLSLQHSPKRKSSRLSKYSLFSSMEANGHLSVKEESELSGCTSRNKKLEQLEVSNDKSVDIPQQDQTIKKHFTRKSGRKNNEDQPQVEETVASTSEPLNNRQTEVEIDGEVRRSGRIRRNRYKTQNQSVLYNQLITNTAEAVLKKMHRRLKKLDNSPDTEEEEMYSGKRKRGGKRDKETSDKEDAHGDFTEDEGEEDQEDEEENQKRYEFRKRKTVVLYQAPQVEPRNHRKQNLFYNGPASPARRRYQFNSAAPRSPYSSKRKNRRRHAIHNSDSTSSSSSASDDEDSFERRRVKSKNGAMNRCLPLNLRKEDLLGLHKDRMKIGASLADVDPMQIDSSVCFDSIGGLSSHILALKEMVVFPLLYPEVFEKFKIQPPRGCLFYGPPGTGKTLVARALANECSQGDRKVAFFMRKGADCLSKWVGESERQLRLLFDQAYQMRPSIIFFDEIDGLAPVRSSRQDQIHSSIVSTLLALMDGLDSRGEVVVIGATNRLDSIDPALRRPGRFDREFLFGLPDRDTRKDILRIHTRQWNPKPSDDFLEELADKCVGYCGADIKSVCAEAALCALRRHYPQIYATTEKLQLNVDSIQINSRDFMVAMQKTVPASQRAVSSPGKALSPIVKPLLENALQDILVALSRVFPHAEQAIKRQESSDFFSSEHTSHILDEQLIYSDDEGQSVYENNSSHKSRQQKQFLHFKRSAHYNPTSYRPRFLLAGRSGDGQSSHLAPAVLHVLEKFTVYTLGIAVLYGVSTASPEETCAQLFCEAKRTSPSIMYLPNIDLWWDTMGAALKATFVSLLRDIPSFSPILLLATCSSPHKKLHSEIQDLFLKGYGEVYHVQLPTSNERKRFFEDLILHQAAKAPGSQKKAVQKAMEVLPLAPPVHPRQLTEQELRRLEEQEEDTLRELRIFLRNVTSRLTMDKRFRAFTKPVDLEEVDDYCQVIKQPMDLSTVLRKIDMHKYSTVKEYLCDVDLICSNALEYNPDKDPTDRLIRHRACALKDTTHAIIKEELDEEFEKICEGIQESRQKRGCPDSKFAPSYYKVQSKQTTAVDLRKSDADVPKEAKPKVPAKPMAASTPSTFLKKQRRRCRWSCGIITKKRKLSQTPKGDQSIMEEDDDAVKEIEEGEGGLENTSESSLDQTDVEICGDPEQPRLIERGQADGAVPQTRDNTPSGTQTLLPEPATKKKVAAAPAEKPAGAVSNGVVSETAETWSDNDQEGNEVPLLRATRSSRSKLEQQQFINVKKALEILSAPTPDVLVDHDKLKGLLTKVIAKTDGYAVYQLEKLYAVICQCIYNHRKDYDKTALIQEMQKEIDNFIS
ncbi:ATPase family AAA domain-containing protein 2-like isoform X2 [Acipenser ruthenus]|uniref:ATPase family AAA domain-containing protein 2-like isoform X2 n=1 Tax=Acipenser ruthenus TaxID=7906 RepID=UPI00274255E9|nr:ATPase family AAA domain-containing protein 2-like isoform X2 [Acipenser ruthenus]